MPLSRRTLLKTAALGLALPEVAPLASPAREAQAAAPPSSLPAPFEKLAPLGDRVHPITPEEFQGRVAQAQRLMREAKPAFGALYLSPSTSLYYYAGIRWSGGERLFAFLLPAQGEPVIVCPAFEEGRARELLRWPLEVRGWQEDESPYALVAKSLADRGLRSGRVGVEETMPYFFFDGLRQTALAFEYASAYPVTFGCRARKSAHELELMRLACHATVDVYRAVFASLREGMTDREARSLVSQGFAGMGLQGGALVGFGAGAALPHGSIKPQRLAEGDGVLIDGGTAVEGYASDVTRTSVFGKASDKLRRAFDTVRRSQDAALAAAQRGRTCGSVDDAARRVVVEAGYGQDYELFTHRVGHGIGLDGHEHPYLVRGNKIVLEPGMTFSDEPGIYVQGDYGLRLEDIMAVHEEGPAQLLTPSFSPSLENPCG